MKLKTPINKYYSVFFSVIMAVLILSTSSVYAEPAVLSPDCRVINDVFAYPRSPTGKYRGIYLLGVKSHSPFSGGVTSGKHKFCIFPQKPNSINTSCDFSLAEKTGQINYVALINTDPNLAKPAYCLYQYDVDFFANNVRKNGALAQVSPFEVPVFTPYGLLITLFGLAWFGRRRSKKIQ